jgi:hypothetical protein
MAANSRFSSSPVRDTKESPVMIIIISSMHKLTTATQIKALFQTTLKDITWQVWPRCWRTH